MQVRVAPHGRGDLVTNAAGPDTERGRAGAWALATVVGCAALLRLHRIDHQSLWFDEGTTLNMSDGRSFLENVRRFYGLTAGGERFQPLYNLVMSYWRSWFGDSAFALRSFSALAGLGAVVLVILTARYVFGRRYAVWTGALAASSSFAVFYSQEARPYAFLLLLSSAQVFCLSPVLAGKPREGRSPWWFRAHLLVVLIGSFGSIFFLLFSAALAAAQLVVLRAPRDWLRWWIPAALAAVPSLFFYLGTGLAADPANSIVVTRYGFPVFESAAFVVYGLLVGTTYGPSVLALHGDQRWAVLRAHTGELAALAVVLLTLVSLLVSTLLRPAEPARETRRPGAFLALTAVIALALATALAVATRVTWLPRHSFFLWIPIVLLLPLVEAPALAGKRALVGRVALVLFLVANLYSLQKYYYRYDYSKDDYRAVAAYVNASENVGTPSVLAWGWGRLLRYYGDTRTVDASSRPFPQLAETVRELTAASPSALVVLTHEEFWRRQAGGDLPTIVAPLYDVQDKKVFQNVTVYKLALKPAAPR
jgi:hypothetical protein